MTYKDNLRALQAAQGFYLKCTSSPEWIGKRFGDWRISATATREEFIAQQCKLGWPEWAVPVWDNFYRMEPVYAIEVKQ